MKEKILKLRSKGKTYNEIKKLLGCSKGTISFHCGDGQKEKYRIRNRKGKLDKRGINEICEYGCDGRALYFLKNGKWCCSKNHNHCEETRKKNADKATRYLDRENEIIQAYEKYKSLLEVSKKLKIPYGSILRHAKKLSIVKLPKSKTNLTKAEEKHFKKICKRYKSMSEARRQLNLPFSTFKRIAVRLKVYFPNAGRKGILRTEWSLVIPYKIEDILSNKNIKVSSVNSYRKRLIRFKIKSHKCEVCKRTKWNKKPIPLELDHIDGIKTNNRLTNLRTICPNCHAQTPNYKGKNIKTYRMKRLNQQQQG